MIVLDVRDEARFGASAVLRLGRELRISEKTLYRYASVAEQWTSEEFKVLALSIDAEGRMLKWSHWERLSTVSDHKLRQALLDRALSQSLSVRGLNRAIIEMVPGRTDGTGHEAEAKTTPRHLVRILSSLEAKAREVDQVFANSAAGNSKPSDSELSELKGMSKQIDETVAVLNSLTTRVKAITSQPISQMSDQRPHDARTPEANGPAGAAPAVATRKARAPRPSLHQAGSSA